MNMVGKVVVGDGGAAPEPSVEDTSADDESSTPSVGLLVGVLAVIAVALVARRL